jgi:4-amino-4-deoxy-L-arabinose transferase-like glycosyltransferase
MDLPGEIAHGERYRRLGWGVLVAAALLQLALLRLHSLRNNECITLQTISYSWRGVWVERIAHNHMPVYFLAVKALTQLLGQGEFALRLLSAVAMWGALWAIWRLAVRLLGGGWGLVALGWLAAQQIALQLATDTRPYAWLLLAGTGALWCLVAWLEGDEDGAPPRRRWWAGLALFSLLGIMSHMLFLLTAAALAVYLGVWARRTYPRWRGALAALALPLLLWLPVMLWWAGEQDKLEGAPAEVHPELLWVGLKELSALLLGDEIYEPGWFRALNTVAFFGMIALAAVAWRRWRADPAAHLLNLRHAPALWLLVALPVMGIPLAQLHASDNIAQEWRYYLPALAALPLLVAAVLRETAAWLGARRTMWLGAAYLALLVANSVWFLATGDSGLRPAAHYIRARWQPADQIAGTRHKNRTLALAYYGAAPSAPPDRPASVNTPGEIMQWLRETSAGHARIWVVFYDRPQRDAVLKVLRTNQQEFKELLPPHAFGETAVGLYAVRTDASPTQVGEDRRAKK